MHRELEWPVSEATCLYAHLYMVYIHLYKIIEGTRSGEARPLVRFRASRAKRFADFPMPKAVAGYLYSGFPALTCSTRSRPLSLAVCMFDLRPLLYSVVG
jgi:hypothetical protein